MNEIVDYDKAFLAYNRSMTLGSTEALFPLGLMYAYNLTDYAKSNNNLATALTYYYFSALDDHIEGQLALGFRHYNGVGAPKNCKTASHYYKLAAEKVVAEQENDQVVMLNEYRLLSNMEDPEFHAENELLAIDPISAISFKILAFRYYYGVRGYKQDFQAAFDNFEKAAMLGDPKAQASLGEMYLKGQGVEQSYEMALEYFNQSAEVEDPKGQVGMAYLLAEGLGVDEDLEEARALLEKAATQYDPDALYNMGTFYLTGKTNNDQTNYDLAVTYFNRAISYGHTLAAYNLGLIHMHGIGSYKSCSLASNLFKFVAERGVHSLQLKEAYEKYQGGKVPQAFSRYLQLAEQGFETAQLNAELISENYNHTKILNGMLAENENPMGLLRLGDHYYYREDDKKIAFSYYRASEKLKNAQASFNIAYMYHFGEGISEDYYMALRHYNLAIERDGIAYYPVKAMLWVLDYPDIAYWLTSAL